MAYIETLALIYLKMNKLKILTILFLISSQLFGQNMDCDYSYEHIFPTGKSNIIAISKVEEDKLNAILWICPDHEKTHKTIQEIREFYCISIPIMSLMWRNTADPYSNDSKKNIKKIEELSERYLSFNSKGTSIAIPRNFVIEWDADYENNISSLEAGFTLIGFMNHVPDLKSKNSAERLIKSFDKIFIKADSTRNKRYGFYYDFYYDYFWSIYKSEHFKTAMYLCMLGTKEDEISTWIEENPEKVVAFADWRNMYLKTLSKI